MVNSSSILKYLYNGLKISALFDIGFLIYLAFFEITIHCYGNMDCEYVAALAVFFVMYWVGFHCLLTIAFCIFIAIKSNVDKFKIMFKFLVLFVLLQLLVLVVTWVWGAETQHFVNVSQVTGFRILIGILIVTYLILIFLVRRLQRDG